MQAVRQRDDGANDRCVLRAPGHLLDKAAVDFQLVNRKAPQVAHARIPGAEIIDRYQNAHAADGLQDAYRLLRIAHHRALGEFDLEEPRLQGRGVERAANLIDQVDEPELRGRKVHGDAQGTQPFTLPRLRLAAGFKQHPFADVIEQAAFIGDRDEIVGRHQAALRMPPADQGFRTVDPTARGVDLRLVVQFELPAAQRLMQVALEFDALLRHRAHSFGIALHVIAASFLGAVHGGVGARDQGVYGRSIAREERDADTGGDVDVDAVQPHRGFHLLDRPFADLDRFRLRHGSPEQDHELIASQACGGIHGANRVTEALRDLAQQFIARPVPEGVVDELESVEVDYQNREFMRMPLRLDDGLGNAVIEQQAVWQAGERVVGGEMPQLPVGRLEPFGTIGDDQFEALDVALECAGVLPLAAQRTGALQDLDRLEGLLDDDELVRVPEPRQQLQPVIVGVGGADDHLYVRVHLPQVFDGLEPVPPRRHAHVDEGDRVRTALRQRQAGALDSIATLKRGIHVEGRAPGLGRLLPEQPRFGGRYQRLVGGHQDLAVVLVNGRVVIDHEDAMHEGVGFTGHRATPAR